MKTTKGFRRIVSGAALALAISALSGAQAEAQADLARGDRMPYDAFDKLPKTDLDVPGGMIHVAFAPGDISLPKSKILEWVETSAKAVSTYYGRFPVNSLKLLLVPVDGPRVRGGTTWGYRGAAIRVLVGRMSSAEDLRKDWVLVHEMVHLALPDMEERYNWLSEGLAVYVEPVARVQAGDLSATEIWQAMMRDMPKGLPQPGDEGLDNTDTWGRKYWGGAMFEKQPATGSACRMPCAEFSQPEAIMRSIGRSNVFWRPPTRRLGSRCSPTFTTSGAQNP
jgi:hypothetical protein